MSDLAGHLETTHHVYLRKEERRLSRLLRDALAESGPRRSELRELEGLLDRFWADMIAHLIREERVLFPIVRMMESSEAAQDGAPGFILNPIRVMKGEHEHTSQLLSRMRTLTEGFAAPDGGRESRFLLLEGLRNLEADTRLHFCKENEILFMKALRADKNEQLSAVLFPNK